MSILNGFKQEVRSELPETRFKMSVLDTVSPPRILDTIVTDLHILYQSVECVDPLDVDLDKPGTASDHKMVIFTPLNNAHNVVKRIKKRIDYRPYTDKGFAVKSCCSMLQIWDNI